MRHRLIVPVFRSPHAAAYTARGVANGVFWGLTPTIGLQTLEIVISWHVGRKLLGRDSSLVQALIWVWINNPLTVLPLYYTFYLTGLWLLGGGHASPSGYDAFAALFDDQTGSWLETMTRIAETAGAPLLMGCLPYAVLGSVLAHRWALAVVRRRRARIARRNQDSETFRTSDSSG